MSAGLYPVHLCLLLAVFICCVQPAGAFQAQQVNRASAVSEEVPAQLGFADQLFAEQDYYRAVTEYKRFVYLYPKHAQTARARLNMARAAIEAQRWEDAGSMLEQTLEQDSSESIRAQAHVLLAEIPYLQGDFDASFRYLERLGELRLDPVITPRVKELQLWSMLHGERLEQAQEFLYAQEIDLRPDLEDVMALKALPRKSPRLAGTLSALVPGAGQLYNGRYREAGMAFTLNAAFIAGGIQAINTGNTVLGGILLFFEAGWYGGNIYNAVNTAHKTNRRRYRSALGQLRDKYQFSLLSDERGPMLHLRTRF
ncbi:MAG: tetratricopeptide repeat protein [Desulfuromonadaceae bacterium]|nr:tetratricopeptide repeat protein [Geobacteraceae bacterium]